MKKLFLTFLFLLSVITSFAYDALIDGVYYNLNKDEQTAEVTNATGMGWSYSYSSSVVIPETITFEGVSYSVTSIGANTFSSCNVTSVTMPNTVTTIGGHTFAYCSALSSITLSSSLKNIGEFAFNACQGLTSIEIPNSVTSIDDYAFSGCSGLTSLTIGNSVETIGQFAFGSCSGLTSIVIPNSVKSLGESVFYGCSNLVTVTLGHSVTSVESNFFLNCRALTTLIVDKDNPYFSVQDNVLFNKDMTRLIFSLPTKSGNYAVPNSVTTIDEAAFSGCTGLTSIEIPNSVTSIGASAFSGCTGLTSLVVDNGNQSYSTEDNVLYNKDKSELLLCLPGRKGNFVIPTSVKAIGAYAFCGCSLTSIDIPNSVANIGSYALVDCSGLTSIALPNSLTKIEDGVFAGCSLTSIEIPNSIKTIGNSAFAGSGLTSIEIPNSVTSIGASAFSGCSKLASISLPRSLTDIGDYAFFAIDNSLISVKVGWKEPIGTNFFAIGFNFQIIEDKTDLYVPRGTKEAYAAVFGWNRFKEIIEYDYTEVVDGIPYIPDYSTNTVDITGGEGQNTGDVVIPETIDIDGESYTVTSIGENAFSGCSDMTSVSIPKSVTSIGDFAFANCTSLSEVYVEWEEPLAIPAHVFANVESSSVRRYKSMSLLSTTLYVPKGTKEKYAAADVWKDFSAIMEYDPTGISSILSDSKAKVAKHLVNGRLIIEKEGKRYDACGAEMK